jgi:hypothetical protein
MTTLAVCAIFRDEGPNLAEWVAYHLSVGADHFFLYDNESSDGGASALQTGPLKSYVTVIPIPSRPAQLPAYRHFIEFHAGSWDWVAFIDLDEFIHPIEADSIKDLLPRYDAFSGVLLHWLNFGPNGHNRRPMGLVIENYTHRLPAEHSINRHVKSLVKTAHMTGEPDVHVIPTKGLMCNSRGEQVSSEPLQDNICHEVMCINHYYTKSREDWCAKLRRGRADALSERVDAWFAEYVQLSKVPDARIIRFANRVKVMLGNLSSDDNREHDVSGYADWMAEIHHENPYSGFPAHQYSTDLQGWGHESPIFEHVISTYRPLRMIEVGSWKGASANRIANLMKQYLIPQAQLVCVDTWLGSAEHWLNRSDPTYFEALNLQWGRPALYNQFLANVIHSGNDDVIIPFPADSGTAAKFFFAKGLTADAIYIDGGHEYEDVIADLVAYWKVLRPGGVMIGDDYVLGWIGVVRAVHDFADRIGATVDVSFHHKFLLEKPAQ